MATTVAEAFLAKIIEAGKFDEDDAKRIRAARGGSIRLLTGELFDYGERVPEGHHVVFSLFEGNESGGEDYIAGDVRVYAFPADPGTPFARFKFNRGLPGGTCLYFDEDGWIAEIVAEWQAILYEEASQVCSECGALTREIKDGDGDEVEATYCGACGEPFEEDETPQPEPSKTPSAEAAS